MNSLQMSQDEEKDSQAYDPAWLQRYKGKWPQWAKMAVVRIGRIILPSVRKERFLSCLNKEDGFFDLLNEFGSPAVQGRFCRYLAELRTADPNACKKMESSFPEPIDVVTFARQSRELPVDKQIKYWKEFSKGFSHPVMMERDSKAFRLYLLVIFYWPKLEACGSMREAYEVAFSIMSKEPCPVGQDPVDHEERQFKWFEKICQRNLGLKLRDRGRTRNTPNGV